MDSWRMGEPCLSSKELVGHGPLTFSACCGAGIWSQSVSFHSYDFDCGNLLSIVHGLTAGA